MIRTRLFIKMIVIYFCIVISTLTMLGILLSFLLNNYLTYNKQTEMLVRARNVSELVRPYLLDRTNPAQILNLLKQAEKNLGTDIWVLDQNGNTMAGTVEEKIHVKDLDPKDVAAIRRGETIFRQGKSTVYGESALWLLIPVISGDQKIIGGMIMYSPIIGVKQTTEKVRNLFIYSAVVSIIFSTIVVHFLARYVTGPLREMNNVAKQMARGNFSERVKVIQGDEIGDLGEAFNYMASQIEKEEKIRREFVADVSHELRSPLTNVLGFIEAMIDGKDKTPQDRNRYLSIIHEETMRLIRLVNELLYLSHLDSGKIKTGLVPVALKDTIIDSIAKIKPVGELSERQIFMNLPEEEICVLGNSDRLEQVVINLLDNAMRYSGAETDILVKVEKKERTVCVTVSDQGEGISDEDMPRIWERFYKADKARCREKGGTGLGLAIVKQIIESFGGSVQVSSKVGKGTEIGFMLPIIDSDKYNNSQLSEF